MKYAEMLLGSDHVTLALLALLAVAAGPVALLVLGAVLIRRGIRIPLLDRRGGNGNGHASTGSTARLNAMDLAWRQKLEAEVEQHQRALYDPDGAVRRGDHSVRNDMHAALLRIGETNTTQIRELREDMRDLRKDIGTLREDLARHRLEAK